MSKITLIEFLDEHYIPYEVEFIDKEKIIYTNDEDLLPFESEIRRLFPDFKFENEIEISLEPNSPNSPK